MCVGVGGGRDLPKVRGASISCGAHSGFGVELWTSLVLDSPVLWEETGGDGVALFKPESDPIDPKFFGVLTFSLFGFDKLVGAARGNRLGNTLGNTPGSLTSKVKSISESLFSLAML